MSFCSKFFRMFWSQKKRENCIFCWVCNEGCFENHIDDGICDHSCNVATCQNDGDDCDIESNYFTFNF